MATDYELAYRDITRALNHYGPIIENALNKTFADMESGQVWTGSTAKDFLDQVIWRKGNLKSVVNSLRNAV